MKNYIFILLVTSIGFAQTISKQVIGAAGKTQSNNNLKVSYTVGEPVVGIMTGGGTQLGNGYHPALNVQALSIQDNALALQVKVYPNPTSQSLFVSHPDVTTFTIQITDLNGKLKYTGAVIKDMPLDVSNYATGIYLITVENKESNIKNTYKFIKE